MRPRARAPTYNEPVSPASRRKPSGTRPDDAPEAVGTALRRRRRQAPRPAPTSRTGCATRPLPGEQPPELSTDERRQLEAEQQATRERNAAAPRRGDRRAPEPRAGPGRHDDRRPAPDPRRRRLAARPASSPIGSRTSSASRTSGPGRSSRSRSRTAPPGELRERIISLVGEPGRDVQAGTFHSLCARVLRRDGEAIGIDRRFVVYDTDDQQALMKQILREEDLPLTGEFRPSAVLGAISRAKNEMLDATFLARERGEPPRADDRPARAALRGAPPAGRRPRLRRPPPRGRPAVRRGARRRSSATRIGGATSTSTSTRTRTGRSTCGSGRSPRSTATSRSSATTTSRSTAGAAPTSGTSSTSSATTPTRRSSSSSATTARRS